MSCNQVLLACNQRAIEDLYQLVMGRTMFKVQCSIVQSQNSGVRVRLSIDEDVQVCLMF